MQELFVEGIPQVPEPRYDLEMQIQQPVGVAVPYRGEVVNAVPAGGVHMDPQMAECASAQFTTPPKYEDQSATKADQDAAPAEQEAHPEPDYVPTSGRSDLQ
eukprot:TRINITY_DN3443_c0_g1_i1.p3 TRINITY_DN3443_c0_g1~~TRINITY_DN3443_c0_g1_i1.p3  ORF type:complete len:102 (+),score=19.40 TRINITY_DN3443_c0_g1_i1:818-1123(+)